MKIQKRNKSAMSQTEKTNDQCQQTELDKLGNERGNLYTFLSLIRDI